ncbi:hypothetical protein [Kitasatospora sp. NPDC050543]|uniref:hypothetical protein n=1 Tax=Kitasatospora sp. NPDC050543 TaxID=3364054 RepID=UPI0037A71114
MTDGAGRTGGWLGDALPWLRPRPVLRRSVAAFLVLCVAFVVLVLGWGVFALTRDRTPPESDRSRAERLAGLHDSQHPGKGRYYIPMDAVYGRLPDGSAAGYLHYRFEGGRDVNVDDFLSTYDLPAPGAAAALPADLRAALPGDEPSEAPLVTDPAGGHRQIYVLRSDAALEGAGDVWVRASG